MFQTSNQYSISPWKNTITESSGWGTLYLKNILAPKCWCGNNTHSSELLPSNPRVVTKDQKWTAVLHISQVNWVSGWPWPKRRSTPWPCFLTESETHQKSFPGFKKLCFVVLIISTPDVFMFWVQGTCPCHLWYILEQTPVFCWILEPRFAMCTLHRFFHGVHWFIYPKPSSILRSFHWTFPWFQHA